MGALQDLADEVHNHLTGFGLVSSRSAWLKNPVDASEVSWTLDESSVSMGEGIAEIEDELVYVRQYASDSGALIIAPDGRGYDGTVAGSHTAGTRIRLEPTFPKTAVKRAINSTLKRCYPTIWGTAATEFTFDSSQYTYALPADAVKVLGVTFDAWGSTGVWPDINSYSFDGAANTTVYPTGKTITLGSAPHIGRTVRVLYAKAPSELTEVDDDFTDSGLAESARYAIILGATAQLVRFNDPVRVASGSAQADEYDAKKPYLTGLKIANDFEQQFQNELRQEAVRLRQTYPSRIVRKRL